MALPFASKEILVNKHLLTATGGQFFFSGIGVLLANNATIVRTTGTQFITGEKYFGSTIRAGNSIHLTGGDSYLYDIPNAASWGNGKIIVNGGEFSVDYANRGLYDAAQTQLFNWEIKSLTGNWSINGTPTSPFHIVNKNFLDTNSSTGGLLTESGKFAKFDKYGEISPDSLPIADLHKSIDSRLFGKSNASGIKLIYSTRVDGSSTYVRNTGCWAYGLDLTPIAVYNSDGVNEKGGVLISPRDIVFANHFQISSGATIRFVDRNNNVVSRTLSSHTNLLGTDVQVGRLDSDVPSSISHCRLLDTGWMNIINGTGIPLLAIDKEQNALVYEIKNNVQGNILTLGSGLYGNRSGFYEVAVGGDSGGGLFAVIGNSLFLVSTFLTTSTGPNYLARHIQTGVNTILTGVGSAYRITSFQPDYPINYSGLANLPVLGNAAFLTASYTPTNGNIPTVDVNGQINPAVIPTGLTFTGVVANVVYTTGTQTISGSKTFANPIATSEVQTSNNLPSLSVDDRLLVDSSSIAALDWNSRQLSDSNLNVAIDWEIKQITGTWNYERFVGKVQSGASASSLTVNWSNANYFYQPLTGNLTVSFTGNVNGQTINIVTLCTGNHRITWPTGAPGGAGSLTVPVKWPSQIPYSGTSGSSSNGKTDVFTFLQINNQIFANYSPNHF